MSFSGKVLGLIPAKGGSTRLPRKNILPLGGRPLIAWTIDAMRAAGVIDRIIVSTEDEKVATIARAYGAETPFLRPLHLACDPAGVVEVCLHALDELEARGEHYDILVICLPTCPFRNGRDIRDALALFRKAGTRFLMSIAEFDHTPFAALRMDTQGQIEPWFPEYFGRKSQELPQAYRPNGAIHVLDIPVFRQVRSYIATPLVGYVMPYSRSIDIDTEDDLRLAEWMVRSGMIDAQSA